MSLVDWYLYKADQCGRMAKISADPQKRVSFKKDEKLWHDLAEQAEMDEENQFRKRLN
ncbi:MAG TPA: hypothetical protein VGF53_09640 [Pseudolabrys sp.]|jgi:hypothetical protein